MKKKVLKSTSDTEEKKKPFKSKLTQAEYNNINNTGK